MDFTSIESRLKSELDEKRYYHTLGVAYTAACMAMSHGYDYDKAYLTGLLHDCAKRLKSHEQIEFALSHDVALNESEISNPPIVHAKTGVYIAKEEYGIDDEEILNAISYHTTGRPNMGLLEKIIYIADYIEPHRCIQPRLNEIRQEAFKDIDKALVMILEDSLTYLKSIKPDGIDPMTLETYNYYA